MNSPVTTRQQETAMPQRIWAISDLHLSFARLETHDRAQFGGRWKEHAAQIEAHWREVVAPEDLVLIPGDFSMARNHREAQADLRWLERLPGAKVLSPGNHDRWFNKAEKVRPLLRSSQSAVDGDAIETASAIVCGARSAEVPPMDANAAVSSAAHVALKRLEQALEHAQTIRDGRPLPILALWHYPPFDRHLRAGPWVECLERHQVAACVYGHLHGINQWRTAPQGVIRGVRYACVAADAIGFRPLRIST